MPCNQNVRLQFLEDFVHDERLLVTDRETLDIARVFYHFVECVKFRAFCVRGLVVVQGRNANDFHSVFANHVRKVVGKRVA